MEIVKKHHESLYGPSEQEGMRLVSLRSWFPKYPVPLLTKSCAARLRMKAFKTLCECN